MSDKANLLFLLLILSHILGDFFFQPDSWVKDKIDNKCKSNYMIAHSFLHGVLSTGVCYFYFFDNWTHPVIQVFFIFAFISVTHWMIDAIKVHLSRNYKWFIIDQLLHVFMLMLLTYGLIYVSEIDLIFAHLKSLNYVKILTISIFYILMLKPTSILVGEVLFKWEDNIRDNGHKGLKDAGKYIGYIERILILTFVVTSQYAAIGFVLAAKSIFRMGELKENGDRQFTEYVMVGTLLSVSIALFSGIFVVYTLGLKS
ncbi:DUF3307 domain-containing protein [Vibrio fluvialis]|nr:DUF3307 domain-containing protein [Vibrio fluvialis]